MDNCLLPQAPWKRAFYSAIMARRSRSCEEAYAISKEYGSCGVGGFTSLPPAKPRLSAGLSFGRIATYIQRLRPAATKMARPPSESHSRPGAGAEVNPTTAPRSDATAILGRRTARQTPGRSFSERAMAIMGATGMEDQCRHERANNIRPI